MCYISIGLNLPVDVILYLNPVVFVWFHWKCLAWFLSLWCSIWICIIYLQPWRAWCPENYTWYHIYQKMESQNWSCCYYTWPWRSHWCVALGKVSFNSLEILCFPLNIHNFSGFNDWHLYNTLLQKFGWRDYRIFKDKADN